MDLDLHQVGAIPGEGRWLGLIRCVGSAVDGDWQVTSVAKLDWKCALAPILDVDRLTNILCNQLWFLQLSLDWYHIKNRGGCDQWMWDERYAKLRRCSQARRGEQVNPAWRLSLGTGMKWQADNTSSGTKYRIAGHIRHDVLGTYSQYVDTTAHVMTFGSQTQSYVRLHPFYYQSSKVGIVLFPLFDIIILVLYRPRPGINCYPCPPPYRTRNLNIHYGSWPEQAATDISPPYYPQ